MTMLLYKLENVEKSFSSPEEKLEILKNINLEIFQGEAVGVIGASGSGKSTLLHLMGALDKPTSGKIFFEDKNLAEMSRKEQARFRNKSLGFVFQFHHLLPEFTALENAAMPGVIAGLPKSQIYPEARRLLERTGLGHRLHSRPATLSGGERQRVAIARAMALKPKIILADEPTGNLDEASGAKARDLLLELNREAGSTLVIVTHNMEIAESMDRTLELRAGEIYEKSRH